MINFTKINWTKHPDSLCPVIIQDNQNLQVLMLGYFNKEALEKTCQTRRVTFFSRSKQRLWQKGEISGNYLEMLELDYDCDQDAFLVLAKPHGPTCHLKRQSCFKKARKNHYYFLEKLWEILSKRREEVSSNSYTCQLLKKGVPRIAQKVGEEGVEVALAARDDGKASLVEESADLIYHLYVLLLAKNANLKEVVQCLMKRHASSKKV